MRLFLGKGWLADRHVQTIAEFKCEYGASNLGFLAILDDPDSMEGVALWFRQATSLTMVSQNGAMLVSDEILALSTRAPGHASVCIAHWWPMSKQFG